jgi:hypothetical protein
VPSCACQPRAQAPTFQVSEGSLDRTPRRKLGPSVGWGAGVAPFSRASASVQRVGRPGAARSRRIVSPGLQGQHTT